MTHAIPPIPPDCISDEARDVWAVVVPQLEETQDLRAVDAQLLLMYCEETVRYRRLRAEPETTEITSKTGRVHRQQSAESQMADALISKLTLLGRELGIGVSSRSKVSKRQEERYEGDERKDLMSRKGRKAKSA